MNQQQTATSEKTKTMETGGQGSEDRSAFALTPDVDIYEDEKGIYVLADMPGVSRDRLNIQVNKDSLSIEGEALIEMPEGMEAMYADVRSTRYHRSFALSSELDTEQIDASLREGVLTIRIPKRAEAMPRKIEVTAG